MDNLDKIVSPYFESQIVLTTKHQKSVAISSAFSEILGAQVYEHALDTDQLGTFSGEIERKGSPLQCVKEKCEWGMSNQSVPFGLASEGSFGTHPLIPFIPCNTEILYFIDKQRNIYLHLAEISTSTNYQMSEIKYFEDLIKFAEKAMFPSHALIIRSFPRNSSDPIFKGLNSLDSLENAFHIAKKHTGKIWVETDMRAHMNPTRMAVIQLLATKMAKRLSSLCPACDSPGWGKINVESGLPCMLCGSRTDLIKADVFGCTKCTHIDKLINPAGIDTADPAYCNYCNP